MEVAKNAVSIIKEEAEYSGVKDGLEDGEDEELGGPFRIARYV